MVTIRRVVVCGDRHWKDTSKIADRLWDLLGEIPEGQTPKAITIIVGGCRGADTIAEEIADSIGFTVKRVEAEWTRFGNAAGPKRNRRMLDMKPDIVIAFHPDLTRSKGTKDTVNEARQRGIPVEVIG